MCSIPGRQRQPIFGDGKLLGKFGKLPGKFFKQSPVLSTHRVHSKQGPGRRGPALCRAGGETSLRSKSVVARDLRCWLRPEPRAVATAMRPHDQVAFREQFSFHSQWYAIRLPNGSVISWV